MNYQRKQEKIIKQDYVKILPIIDLVYKLFEYDTDGNNAFLESSDNVLSESTTKTSSIWRKFKSNNSELRPVGYSWKFIFLLFNSKFQENRIKTVAVTVPSFLHSVIFFDWMYCDR